eukprot:jgi/Botrbrau1/16987/Bobra.49_2s0046.1
MRILSRWFTKWHDLSRETCSWAHMSRREALLRKFLCGWHGYVLGFLPQSAAIAKLRSRCLCGPHLKAWMRYVEKRRESKKKASRALSWWGGRAVRARFCEWREISAAISEDADTALHHWDRASKKKTMQAWQAAVKELQRLRHCAATLMVVGLHRTKLKAWRSWQDFFQVRLHRHSLLERALSHMLHRLKLSALTGWRTSTAERVIARNKGVECIHVLQAGLTGRALRAWASIADQRVSRRRKADVSLKMMMTWRVRGCFDRWKEWANYTRAIQMKLFPVVQRLRLKALATAMGNWRWRILSKRNLLGILDLALTRWRLKTLSAVFHGWVHVAEQRAQRRAKNLLLPKEDA